MVFRHRIVVAVLCALALLVAQQGAFAHALSHFDATAGFAEAFNDTEAGAGDRDGDGKTASAAHTCVTCLAFGVCAAPPMAAVAPGLPAIAAAAPDFAPIAAGVAGRTVLAYASRAPPVFL